MGKMSTQNETGAGTGIMCHLDNFLIIFLKTSTHTIHPIYFQKSISFSPKELVEMGYSITEEERRLAGPQ